MFCTECGRQIEEGRAFCKHCGHPVLDRTPTATPPPAATPPPSVAPPSAATPSPAPTPPPAPAPPAAQDAWEAQQGPQPRRSRTGLLVGIIAAAVIVLAGVGVGVYFTFFNNDKEGPVAGTTTHDTTTESTTDTLPRTQEDGIDAGESIVGADGTVHMTVPLLDPDALMPQQPDAVEHAFRAAADDLAALLRYTDARVPELAARINDTAPKVPPEVSDELMQMLFDLEASYSAFGPIDIPDGYYDAWDLLIQAYSHMYERVASTLDGVEIMRSTGKVDAAKAAFDQGRISRDAYRKTIDEYYDAAYIE